VSPKFGGGSPFRRDYGRSLVSGYAVSAGREGSVDRAIIAAVSAR
jgi:hypothetical protein